LLCWAPFCLTIKNHLMCLTLDSRIRNPFNKVFLSEDEQENYRNDGNGRTSKLYRNIGTTTLLEVLQGRGQHLAIDRSDE